MANRRRNRRQAWMNGLLVVASAALLMLVLALWVLVNPVIGMMTLLVFVAPAIWALSVFTARYRKPHGARAMTIEPNLGTSIILGGDFEKSIHGTMAEKLVIAHNLKKQRKLTGKKPNQT